MLTYNTQRKKLVLPEYGRNLQKMVDYCLTIEDKEQRMKCAESIIKTMSILFPKKDANRKNSENTYWDLLAIMSDFSLDIDWPEGTVKKETLSVRPQPVPMTQGPMSFHVYGKNIQRMMEYAMDLPGGEEKDDIIMMVANQMKKQLSTVYPEGVDDERIFKDIALMTHGEIHLDSEHHKLMEVKPVVQNISNKKKKKK